jgi:hypothetical protein
MIATFDGVPIFGTAVEMTTTDDPRETQYNAFFGIDGQEWIDGGFRRRTTTVKGLIYGQDLPTFLANKDLIRSCQDNVDRVLSTTTGETYQNVILTTFKTVGRVRQSPEGYVFQSYSAILIHLSIT